MLSELCVVVPLFATMLVVARRGWHLFLRDLGVDRFRWADPLPSASAVAPGSSPDEISSSVNRADGRSDHGFSASTRSPRVSAQGCGNLTVRFVPNGSLTTRAHDLLGKSPCDQERPARLLPP